MAETTIPVTEADILTQIVEPTKPGLPAEVARAILDLHFNETAVESINALAEKNRQGALTEEERATLDRYLRVGNFLNLLQAKAKLSLSAAGKP